MEYDINLFYYINIFKKYRKKVTILMAIVVAMVFINTMMKPPAYASKCSILLTDYPSGPSMSNLSKFIGFPGFSFSNSSANTIIAIVKSRRMREGIYSNFKELREKPNFNLRIEVYDTTEGTLIIEVKGREPKLVSEIANFCAKNMDTINADLNITPQRPMVKVLDQAVPALRPDSRQMTKKLTIGMIFAFVSGNLFFFGLEYYRILTAARS